MNELTRIEKQTLENCEQLIQDSIDAYYAAGAALCKINEGKLYRTEYDTFEQYLGDRWGFSRPRGYQLIQSWQATKDVEDLSTIVDKPKNEAQARELIPLETPQERADVWTKVCGLVGDGKKLSASLIAKVRKEYLEEKQAVDELKPREPSTTSVETETEEDPFAEVKTAPYPHPDDPADEPEIFAIGANDVVDAAEWENAPADVADEWEDVADDDGPDILGIVRAHWDRLDEATQRKIYRFVSGKLKPSGLEDLELPYDSDEFREAWYDFIQMRIETKHPAKPTGAKKSLKKLAGWGEQRAIAALEHTTANEWQGIREPDRPDAPRRNGKPSGQLSAKEKAMQRIGAR